MDGSKLSLASLKDKISSKMNLLNKSNEKPKKKGNKKPDQKESAKPKENKRPEHKEHKPKETKPISKDQKKPKQNTNDEEKTEEELLREEAFALGATEEDLALLKGIEEGEDSEQEFDGDSKSIDKTFSTDLSQFMKGIGLGKGEAVVVDDVEDVPELVDEEEEEEEDDQEEQEEEEEEDEKEEESSESSSDESESEIQEKEMNKKELANKSKESAKDKSRKDQDKITDFSSVNSTNLTVPNRTDWYNTPLERIDEPEKLDRFGIERCYERAKTVIEKDNKTYLEEFTSNNSQKKFLSQILADGTLNDKISALTLLIQEAPLHNMKAFDTLLGYCSKKSRTAALQSINALKDLLLNGVLPDRKLVAFNKQPLTRNLSDVQLAIYYFEDYLKKSYFKLISTLEVLSHDPIIHVRMNVVSHLFDLIKAKPEQEANLLRLGVNKLGDIDNKVSSKTSYQILQLEQTHPAMKKVITDSVVDIIFKSNSDYHAQYYSIVTLNQTILTRREDDLANTLIKTYFALFEKILVETDHNNAETNKDDKALGKSEKGRKNNRKNFKKGKKGGKSVKNQEKSENEIIEDKNTRLFSALLTGLNRAFPFSNLPNETYQKHLDTLFKITHSSNFNTSIQALVLVNHIITSQKLDSDRYYRTLYESLLDPRLVTTSKQGIYLNLLYKSLKNDTENIPRVLAFVKRILQISSHWLHVGAITGMLFLLMQLSKTYPQIQDLSIDIASRPDEEDTENDVANTKDSVYDSRKRDPKFANADKSSLWEIGQFLTHYHPTVAIYAASLLDGNDQPKPDLGLFTLSHFLDRFVYRNSKLKPMTKGSSIMQPLGGAHTGSLLVKATNVANTDIPANTENWLNKKVENIQPDEKFFHQYFTTKISKLKNKESKKQAEDEVENEEEAEAMQDDEIWKALVKSRPEVEDASDEDDFSDFDADDFSDMSDAETAEVEGEDNAPEDEEEEIEELPQTAAADESDEEEESEMFAINGEDEYDSDEAPKMLGEDNLSSAESEPEADQDSKKRKASDENSAKSKRSKLKSLPIFASADDYSQYLDSEDEDYS